MSELLQIMATNIDSLTLAEKLMGGAVVTLFSMGLVFTVLVTLMFVIKAMTKYATKDEVKLEIEQSKIITQTEIKQTNIEEINVNEEEIVAAIIAAINANYSSSQSKIVIKNITRNNDNWSNSGLLEQLNSRI